MLAWKITALLILLIMAMPVHAQAWFSGIIAMPPFQGPVFINQPSFFSAVVATPHLVPAFVQQPSALFVAVKTPSLIGPVIIQAPVAASVAVRTPQLAVPVSAQPTALTIDLRTLQLTFLQPQKFDVGIETNLPKPVFEEKPIEASIAADIKTPGLAEISEQRLDFAVAANIKIPEIEEKLAMEQFDVKIAADVKLPKPSFKEAEAVDISVSKPEITTQIPAQAQLPSASLAVNFPQPPQITLPPISGTIQRIELPSKPIEGRFRIWTRDINRDFPVGCRCR